MSNNDMIVLDVRNDEESIHVSKENILVFFKNLKTMPTIDRELVYQDILNNRINLPSFEFEEYFLSFCAYKTIDNKDMIIVKDTSGDSYYYIHLEHVFKCSIFEAGNVFYEEIAKATKKSAAEVRDTLVDKLGCYEAILLAPQNRYLSSLNDFIEDNIYMFNEVLREKQSQINLGKNNKPKTTL